MSLARQHVLRTPPIAVHSARLAALHMTVLPGTPTLTGTSTRCTVQVEGEVDLASAHVLADTLGEQLHQGHRFVRLDLSRLRFIDCAGLGVLVEAHHAFLAARGTLVLTVVDERVATMLRITQLDEVLLVADGFDEPRHARRLSSAPSVDPA